MQSVLQTSARVCAHVCVRAHMHACSVRMRVCSAYVCVLCARVCTACVHVCAHARACVCVRMHVCTCVCVGRPCIVWYTFPCKDAPDAGHRGQGAVGEILIWVLFFLLW